MFLKSAENRWTPSISGHGEGESSESFLHTDFPQQCSWSGRNTIMKIYVAVSNISEFKIFPGLTFGNWPLSIMRKSVDDGSFHFIIPPVISLGVIVARNGHLNGRVCLNWTKWGETVLQSLDSGLI